MKKFTGLAFGASLVAMAMADFGGGESSAPRKPPKTPGGPNGVPRSCARLRATVNGSEDLWRFAALISAHPDRETSVNSPNRK